MPAQRKAIKKELENNTLISHCAKWYGNAGDPNSMNMRCLLRHYPNPSVSQMAGLAGVSVSAASRCRKDLSHCKVPLGCKEVQTFRYFLEDNDFAKSLLRQLERSAP